jgi:hypothetical protein
MKYQLEKIRMKRLPCLNFEEVRRTTKGTAEVIPVTIKIRDRYLRKTRINFLDR